MLESILSSRESSKAAGFLRQLRGQESGSSRGIAFQRPVPRGQQKFVKPKAICSRCERFSFLSEDVGQSCHSSMRDVRCGGCMIATDALRDWSSCNWCSGSGWHHSMCCIKCNGSGWVRAADQARSARSELRLTGS